MEHLQGVFSIHAASVGDNDRSWVEVLVTTGGVAENRGKFVLERTDLETYAARIGEGGGRKPIDYDHSYVARGDTRAAGWFTGAAKVLTPGEQRPDGSGEAVEDELWAEVEWTRAAAQAIRDGEYRFVSAEFTFEERDSKGILRRAKDLLAATLTNRPFFNRMQPVTLSLVRGSAVVWDASTGYMQRQAQVWEALNPGEEFRYCVLDITDGKALVQESMGGDTWVVPFTVDAVGDAQISPSSDWVPAEQQWVQAATEARRLINHGGEAAPNEGDPMDLKVIAKSLGLDENTDEATVLAKLEETNVQAARAAELEVENKRLAEQTPNAELLAQAARGAAAAEKLHELTVKTTLDEAERDGQILPAQREALEAQAATAAGLEQVQALIAATPKRAFGEKGAGSAGEPATDEERQVAAARGRFEYDTGSKIVAADKDSLALHVKAETILAAKGKGPGQYSEDEYVAAIAEASRA